MTRFAETWYKYGVFALLTTLGVFGLILVLARLKAPLASAIFAGTVAIGLMFGLRAGDLLRVVLDGAARPMTLGVIAITVLLLTLSQVMRDSGQLEEIVACARVVFRRPAVAIAALPALIGLLPMPGGALFSAPMVESAAGGANREGGTLSAINYWFRHIWEHWWPLYPGVILAMTLTDSDLGVFVVFQLPLGIFMTVSGLLLFRRTPSHLHVAAPAPPAGSGRRLLASTLPIWIVLGVWVVVRGAIWGALVLWAHLVTSGAAAEPPELLAQPLRGLVEKFVPILLGLSASLAWTIRVHLRRGNPQRALPRGATYSIAVLVLTVMIFQAMIQRVHVAPRIAGELAALHVPPLLIVAALPFVAGLVTGLSIAFVGASFPIVIGLVEALPGEPSLRPYIVLAFAFGHLGMMLSPLHLCHVVSNRYFQTGFASTYRRLWAPVVATGALAAAYFAILKFFMS